MAPRVRFNVKADQRFGRLTVLGEERMPLTPGRAAHGFKSGLRGARCRCSCGNEVVVSLTNLRTGLAQSCGCLRTEKSMERIPDLVAAATTHGQSNHALYSTWQGMMARCYATDHIYYPRYGGRGITVTAAWHEPAVFLRDIVALLGERPAGHTMDRIDNSRGYEPGNVRWASRSTQSTNRQPFSKKLPDDIRAEMTRKRAAGAILTDLANEYGVSVATAHRYTKDYRTEHHE